jgi:acyl-CoA dehydrogenase
MSKLKASEVAVQATERALQVCGGWGYVRDLPVEKWYRDAKLYTIFEGTSEIQRLVIGRALADAKGEPPLHHGFPREGPLLAGSLGRDTPARSRPHLSLLRALRRAPVLSRIAGRVPSGFWRGGS